MKGKLSVKSNISIKYEWADGYHYKSKADPNIVQQIIEMLAKKDPNGKCTNEALLEYAEQNPLSDVHNCFEWDDSKAARTYRLEQAGEIKGNIIKVEYQVSAGKQNVPQKTVYNLVRANHALRTEPGHGHKSITVIKTNLQDDNAYEQEMYRAIRQFVSSFKLRFCLANNFAKYEAELDKVVSILP